MEVSWDLDKYVGAFNFRISIDGIPQENSKILSVNGASVESDLIKYKFLRLPGQAKFNEVEITRVYQGYDELYNWRLMIEEGVDLFRTVTVEILAPDLNTTVRKIVLHGCWPHRWQLPNLDASSTAPAIETISLAYERMSGQLGGASPGDSYSGEGTAGGSGPKIVGNASGAAYADPEIDDSFWGKASDLSALEDKYNAALELAAQAGELFDPNEETWDPPGAAEDPTAATNGGDGSGPKIVGNAAGGIQEFSDSGDGAGPIGGRGEQDEAEYGDEGESMDPNEETWDGPAAVDDPTAAKRGGDGSGPVIVGNAAGGEQAFADSTSDDGKPIDPNEVTDWGGSAAADDPTAAKRGGDGSGPVIVGSAAGGIQEFSDTDGGTGPIGGRGDQDEADFGDGGESMDPNEESWDAPSAVDDPTAASNGGDGSGPIGGRGAQEAFDGGEGSGPIENEKIDWGGSAAADDPTAAKNGGDGAGPIGGRGEGGGGHTE